jgi:hypothetical protein
MRLENEFGDFSFSFVLSHACIGHDANTACFMCKKIVAALQNP